MDDRRVRDMPWIRYTYVLDWPWHQTHDCQNLARSSFPFHVASCVILLERARGFRVKYASSGAGRSVRYSGHYYLHHVLQVISVP